jgi:lipoprotein-anchoring transpeptidase ErfK/SrfK
MSRAGHPIILVLALAWAVVGARDQSAGPSVATGVAPSPKPAPSATIAPSPSPSPQPPSRACESYTVIGAVKGAAVTALRRPQVTASKIARFPAVNAQGSDQVFPLLERVVTDGAAWYRALLPIRPNGSTGWIPASRLTLRRSDYHLDVDTSKLRLTVFRLCERAGSYPIAVGTKDTPTPHGEFFLNALLRPPPGSIYGAFTYGLSAYSDVIKNWKGGGIVGIHGTNDPSSIGRRVSHGCIRLRNSDITRLVRMLPLGTLVTIHA